MYRRIIQKLKRYQKVLNGQSPNSIAHSVKDNPIGTYLVKTDGQFVWCSDECRHILGIPGYATIQKWNLRDFYYDPNHRDEILNKMGGNAPKQVSETITMRRHGSATPIYVEDYCQKKQKGKEICYYGEIKDVTESFSYQKLFDELSAGVFRLGKEGEFLVLNRAVPKILGEPPSENLIRRRFFDFWFAAEAYQRFIDRLDLEQEVVNYRAKLQHRGKQPTYVTITAKVWRDGNDDFLGYEGTITDVTNEYKLVRAFEKFSTGYFETIGNGQEHHIYNCNTSFAKMLGYNSPKELLGYPILECFYAEADKEAVTAKVQLAYEQKPKSFQKLQVQIRQKNGTPLWVQLDCILRLDKREEITGYEGMLVNVDENQKAQIELAEQRKYIEQTQTELVQKQTELVQNKAKVDDIMKDMDQFIHKFIAPMMNVDSTAQQLMRMLDIRFKKAPEANMQTDQQANAVVYSLTKLINQFELANINSPLLAKLKTKKYQLATRKQLYRDSSLCDLWVREMNMDIYELISNLIRKIEPRIQDQYPIIEDTLRASEKLLNRYILSLMRRIRDNTHITNLLIESLRRNYYSGKKRPLQFHSQNVMRILRKTIASFTEMAQLKSLKIIPPEQNIIHMDISEPHVESMFSNLLHNAIKYSYTRKGAYIRVSTHEKRDHIKFIFENYGVAITPEDKGKLFDYGYRGELSLDHNRTGSGIGLTDVYQTVQKHHGEIDIYSNPAPGNTTEGDYTVPYVTKITVMLPKKQENK